MVPGTDHPRPDASIAPGFLGITGAFLEFGIAIHIAHIYTRLRPAQRLGVDDLFITIAVVRDRFNSLPQYRDTNLLAPNLHDG